MRFFGKKKWNPQQSGVLVKGGILLMIATFCFFLVLGLGTLAQSRLLTSPISSMKGLATAVSSRFFADMIGMEVPQFHREEGPSIFSQNHVAGFLFQFMTDVNPADPKSLLAGTVPGMNHANTIVLSSGKGTDKTALPLDYTPSADLLKPDKDTADDPQDSVKQPGEQGNADGQPGGSTAQGAANGDGKTPQKQAITTNGKRVIFIYHSHNRESWVPELKSKGVTETKDAYDSKINITLLGKRLAERLEEEGIGAARSTTDYASSVKNFNYNFSYKYSLQTLQEAFASNPNLTYFFDIHRDSQNRELTTATIGGKDYAQLFFIVGLRNKNWEKNKLFAEKITEKLDKSYPGLSRGIYSKPENTGNAEYNQSFSPNSILIEVGGPENTLEESNRTIDVLAKVISEVYWDAEKVNSSEQTTPKSVPDAKSAASHSSSVAFSKH